FAELAVGGGFAQGARLAASRRSAHRLEFCHSGQRFRPTVGVRLAGRALRFAVYATPQGSSCIHGDRRAAARHAVFHLSSSCWGSLFLDSFLRSCRQRIAIGSPRNSWPTTLTLWLTRSSLRAAKPSSRAIASMSARRATGARAPTMAAGRPDGSLSSTRTAAGTWTPTTRL